MNIYVHILAHSVIFVEKINSKQKLQIFLKNKLIS